MAATFKSCSVIGCKGNAIGPGRAKGFCRAHYKRLRRHGDPTAGGTRMGARIEWMYSHRNHIGDDCLIWPFSRNESGYPQYKIGKKTVSGCRVMCELAHGTPPTPEHQAAHFCGKGSSGCLNPNHLRWATREENENDKILHGTLPRGERQGRSKLTRHDVKAIRQQASTNSHNKLAKQFGVSRQEISKIVNKDRWSWLS